MECNMHIVGATAIEDKLQVGISETYLNSKTETCHLSALHMTDVYSLKNNII